MANSGTAPTARSGRAPSLDALEPRASIARGHLNVTELAHACPGRLRLAEGEVRAGAWPDLGPVMAEADRLQAPRRGDGGGSLAAPGLPLVATAPSEPPIRPTLALLPPFPGPISMRA